MITKNLRIFATIFMITLLGFSVSASAEEINISSFRNVVAGSSENTKVQQVNLTTTIVGGWQNINDEWYYFKSDGTIQKGWFNDSGAWYYFGQNGIMQHDTTIDGCYLNHSGKWVIN